jgi:hypothetical protein
MAAMELKELRCKSCGAPLAPENVVERLSMARCGHCEAVFALERTGPGSDSRRERPHVLLPKQMEVVDLGTSFEIRRRWFSPVFVFLVFFCLFWNGFMIVWHGIALSQGLWPMSCFGLLHTAVGIALLYFTVAGFVNTTVVRVERGMIEVRHGPLPWPGNKSLEAHDVEQLYCREQVNGNKNRSQCTYEVRVLRQGNVRDTLVKGLTDPDQALYIEQELERHLRIVDQPVAGELGR